MSRHIAALRLGCLIAGLACFSAQAATATAAATAAPSAAPVAPSEPAPQHRPDVAAAAPVKMSHSRSDRDARKCLRFENNRKVMVCAEAYR